MHTNVRSISRCTAAIIITAMALPDPAHGCTGITLKAADGGVVCARTVEWAVGDAHHDRLAVFPRNHRFTALTPDGENGMKWSAAFGFVTLAAYGESYGPDAMNEAGLYVGMYYFPGFASFAPYDPALADHSMSVGDFMRWMLSSFKSVADAKAQIGKVHVVHVDDPRFGGAPLPFHWKISDASGNSMVLEIVDGGQVKVFDGVLGVITNSPGYDWHLTNLRNYLGLSASPREPVTLGGLKIAPLGGGTGLMGLPGDFSPPSRFVRAVALTASARTLATSEDAVFEAFRILDNFNIPVGATAAPDRIAQDIVSATQITTACDLTHRNLYFHTMHNRQIRKLDLKKIDFHRVSHQQVTAGAVRHQAIDEIQIK